MRGGLCPRVLCARRTDVLRFIAGWGDAFPSESLRLPVEAKAGCKQLIGQLVKAAGRHDEMGHVLAGSIAAGVSCVRRHEANGLHLVRPFTIMITASTRIAVRGLPTVRHLMYQGTQYLLVGSAGEGIGVHGELMDGFAIDAIAEAVSGEIAACITLTLKRDKGGG